MKYNDSDLLKNLGINSLNEMQVLAQESILAETNTLLLSPTGSGKTLAYLLPVFQMLQPQIQNIQCLIIVPSRELALQIEQVCKKISTQFKVNTCYGGHDIEIEIKNLSNPPVILIGTPGRIADHIDRNYDVFGQVQTLILDEFDKALELGFHEQMSYIISKLPKINKRVLVSATSNIKIPKYTGVWHPNILDFLNDNQEPPQLTLKKVISNDKDKVNTLFELICSLNSESAIIFCNHREAAERLSNILIDKGIDTVFYHGGMQQEERERALIQFRNRSIRYLITTDLAARGLDIPELNHVIHYHLPSKKEEFTHRNGRTARMLASGTAYIITHESDKDVLYLDENIPIQHLSKTIQLPKKPDFQTLYISGGKKNKLNKIDIVGFILQKGQLEKADIGLIEVKDFISFVAINAKKSSILLQNISNHKIKGKKYKINIARKVLATDYK
ncbi:DEAD/DEAH box helicase [Flavobacterium branchiophilum]|uniref:Helicase n=1 Tax=Flavobacterium branchiophilum TaxID=55197 RepID=A0A2H3KSJ7_9FLAO|nr:DEAD/DEAH box helicase [Flavobacterium branchiophilum]PDS25178.1 helicase [Flavobacterium branchiophilum]